MPRPGRAPPALRSTTAGSSASTRPSNRSRIREVFAAGDCASIDAHPRPKSGVYAVRAGKPLAHNLRAALTGRPLAPFVPQPQAMYLLATGTRHGIAAWGGFSAEGAWVWRLKDHIDRRFMARYPRPAPAGS